MATTRNNLSLKKGKKWYENDLNFLMLLHKTRTQSELLSYFLFNIFHMKRAREILSMRNLHNVRLGYNWRQLKNVVEIYSLYGYIYAMHYLFII